MTQRAEYSWPVGYEKDGTLHISTIGRKTGRVHKREIWFVTRDNRLFIRTADYRRDWVRNTVKNPTVKVTIRGVTHSMKATPITSNDEKHAVSELYEKKYARYLAPMREDRSAKDSAELRMKTFELTPA